MKFAIHPGRIKSKSDGDIHFITARMLVNLYRLKPGEYVIWNDDDRSLVMIWNDYIHLYPLYHGNYKEHLEMSLREDLTIEKEMTGKGLTAPRVTVDQLKSKIKSVQYVKTETDGGQILRWCILNMENGFAVAGRHSASVSPENDNQEIGEKIAYDNAINELWALEGYLLKEMIHGNTSKKP